MPYNSLKEANNAIKGIEPSVTLRQANLIAKWADEMSKSNEESKAWAMAIAQFKKLFTVKNDRWVRDTSNMSEPVDILIPFEEMSDDGWRLYMPFKSIHHMGSKVDFDFGRGEEMVSNFQAGVPDYPLPINERHDDSAGIYGSIADMRLSERGVEWLPNFREGAVEALKKKGYRYASPEVMFSGYTGVYDGQEYNNVALGMAITPRPRLGADTLVFSDGQFTSLDDYEKNLDDKENGMEDVQEEQTQFRKILNDLTAKLDTLLNHTSLEEEELEDAEEVELEDNIEEEAELEEAQEDENLELKALADELENKLREEFSEALEEREAEITELSDQLEEEKARNAKLSKQYAEAERKQRLNEFADQVEEWPGIIVDTHDFAETMMWLHDNNEQHYKRVTQVITALHNQENMANLFAEFGTESYGNDPVSRFENAVMSKVNEGMNYDEAMQAVRKEHPGWYKEYDKEATKPISR